MNYSLFLDTSNRDMRYVKLLKGSVVLDVLETSGDEVKGIDNILKRNKLDIDNISKIDIKRGPGSFTGLKVGASIANAVNYAKGSIKSWDDLILPEYGEEPNISKPKVEVAKGHVSKR